MDGLGLALFGIYLVSFTVSKPVRLYIYIQTMHSQIKRGYLSELGYRL